jgi:hexosaminidase
MSSLLEMYTLRRQGCRARDRLRLVLAAICILLCHAACCAVGGADAPLPLIPNPATVSRSPGYFTLRRGAPVTLRGDNAAALGAVRYFIALTDASYKLHLDFQPHNRGNTGDGIEFVLDPQFLVSDDPGGEGYELTASPHGIRVVARTSQGLLHGAMTLWQLLGTNADALPLQVPRVAISDHPRFAWRGLMIDSARHFQTPDEIKRMLDQMAQAKLNVLHWHLTDDQGWRIEIKKYPKLTEVGAWRLPAGVGAAQQRYGGFYTQEQVRDIVAYATARGITIVPEIEMPGHAQAAIAAYPRLGTAPDHPPPVSHDWGVHTYLFNIDEETFGFLEDVLGEVITLFPGTYVHVGGDEAAKDQWQASPRVQQRMHELGIKDEAALQGWFTARIEKFLAAHGRRLIGWDEILEGGVPPRATVMSWRGTKGGIEAAEGGHDVVMSPSPPMYFDHVQSSRHDEPPGRPDVVSLADVYAYEAAAQELDAAQAKHVLGAQANLWTEYMDTPQRLEHAAFPRAAALAEALWSPAARRSWPDFRARLPAQMARYRASGIAAAESEFAAPPSSDPLRRNSDELLPCKPGQGLALRLPGPVRGDNGGVYNVDIFDPCWVYPGVNLDSTRSLQVGGAALPYNFQLWKDIKNVVSRAPAGQLQVHLDRCDGALIASAAWQPDARNTATLDLALRDQHGTHDLCLIATRGATDPLWAIDSVRLQP